MFNLTVATSSQADAGLVAPIVMLVILITVIAGIWRVFSKAGQPGWGVLIPIYNVYLMCKIAQRPGWWLLLMFVPIVNLIIAITLSIGIARNFGKGAGFGLGLAFLGFIFYPILGFSGARYLSSTGFGASQDALQQAA